LIGGVEQEQEREFDRKCTSNWRQKMVKNNMTVWKTILTTRAQMGGVDSAPWSAEHYEPTMDVRLLAGVCTDCVGLVHREFELEDFN
jgi:hypothetical protein